MHNDALSAEAVAANVLQNVAGREGRGAGGGWQEALGKKRMQLNVSEVYVTIVCMYLYTFTNTCAYHIKYKYAWSTYCTCTLHTILYMHASSQQKKVCIYLMGHAKHDGCAYIYVCICEYVLVHVLYSACITRGHCLAHVTKFWDQGGLSLVTNTTVLDANTFAIPFCEMLNCMPKVWVGRGRGRGRQS